MGSGRGSRRASSTQSIGHFTSLNAGVGHSATSRRRPKTSIFLEKRHDGRSIIIVVVDARACNSTAVQHMSQAPTCPVDGESAELAASERKTRQMEAHRGCVGRALHSSFALRKEAASVILCGIFLMVPSLLSTAPSNASAPYDPTALDALDVDSSVRLTSSSPLCPLSFSF